MFKSDPTRRRQAAASALWIPVGYGVGSFAIAGARRGQYRVIDRNASTRGMGIAVLAAGVVAALRWRYGETRHEADLRRLFQEPSDPMARALEVVRLAVTYGTVAVLGAGASLALGGLASSQRRAAVPAFSPRRIPVAIFESSLLMGGAIVAGLELVRAVRREAALQPWLHRAHALRLPPEPAIIAPGTAEEAFGDLSAATPPRPPDQSEESQP